MKWTAKQDAALKYVDAWFKDDSGPQVCRVFGFAGVGKTELAKHFGSGVDGTVVYGAFTGKAAHVLRTKGCPEASTIHSLIYTSREKGQSNLKDLEQGLSELRQSARDEGPSDITMEQIDGGRRIRDVKRLIEAERKSLAQPFFQLNKESVVKDAALVIIDECSMVDGQMGEDLLSFKTKILVLGDPAQLPPVFGGGFFTENVKPDIMLTEIHRQAAENPIIAMATKVRNKETLNLGSYGESQVVEGSNLITGLAETVDQVLVGKNVTRKASNKRLRQLKGFQDELPDPGEKLVCLRNNHELGLLNGAIWTVHEVGIVEEHRMFMSVQPEGGGEILDVEAHTQYFLGQDNDLSWFEKKEAQEFDYGYALTVHKAQGSQWDDVLLFDESYCFKKDKWKWLYTGITRAAERLTVVRM